MRDRCPTRVGHIEFRFLADDSFSCHSMPNLKIIPSLGKNRIVYLYSMRFCFVLRFSEHGDLKYWEYIRRCLFPRF